MKKGNICYHSNKALIATAIAFATTVASSATLDPQAGEPEGERVALWPAGKVPGMEGLKTGYTQAAGHCLAFSCKRNGRRLYGIVTGFQRRQDCFGFVEKLLEWGFVQP